MTKQAFLSKAIEEAHRKCELLEKQLRVGEMSRGMLRRTLHEEHMDWARERKKLKREIDLLKNSP